MRGCFSVPFDFLSFSPSRSLPSSSLSRIVDVRPLARRATHAARVRVRVRPRHRPWATRARTESPCFSCQTGAVPCRVSRSRQQRPLHVSSRARGTHAMLGECRNVFIANLNRRKFAYLTASPAREPGRGRSCPNQIEFAPKPPFRFSARWSATRSLTGKRAGTVNLMQDCQQRTVVDGFRGKFSHVLPSDRRDPNRDKVRGGSQIGQIATPNQSIASWLPD